MYCTNLEVKPSEHPARQLDAGKALKKWHKVFHIPNQHQLVHHWFFHAESKKTWHVHPGTLQEQTSDLWQEMFNLPRALVKWLASVWCLGIYNENWSHCSPHNTPGAAQGLAMPGTRCAPQKFSLVLPVLLYAARRRIIPLDCRNNTFPSIIMLAKNQTNPDWQTEEKIETKVVPSGAIMAPNYVAPGKSIWIVTWHWKGKSRVKYLKPSVIWSLYEKAV